ncbi:putative periplasmic serine endoprotease DegP-like protein [Nitrospira tepida]|uniref:Periplasmic serine endoprotease DegP-like protein n=1 Tax=Nitrospira tepida TaxID=2973512 RepID=A0AA86N1K7_9BACT|nr:Do family serine endopeptidase [Nitrospira tepida]CAI4032964.1 putative periplasmic serine endoprotease DegP-like protein [Nitrospira tepida]
MKIGRTESRGTVGWWIGGVAMAGLALTTGLGAIGVPAGQAAVPAAFSQGFSEIVKRVTPAVVNIAVTGGEGRREGRRQIPPGPFGGPPGGPPGEEPPGMEPPGPPIPGPHGRPEQSAGSGVIIDAAGHIVTNNHVVENASQITVTLSDKREFPGKVVGTDPKSDLAVIKIDAPNLPSPLKWADYDKLQVGDVVLAVGSPFGLSSTVTLGIISALGRGNVGIADYEDFIQTDAAINPGNSGGALVNMDGELIGINTAIFSRTGGSEGIGFAIPSTIAVDIVDSLTRTGKVVRGWMGVAIQEITPALAKSFKIPENRKGVLISDVNENGPSFAAGIKRGDVVVSFNGKEVQSVSQLRNLVARTIVGKDAEIKILRDGKEQVLNVKVAERPSDEMLARREPGPPAAPEPAKLPDNVLAALRVQPLDAAMLSQFNLPAKTAGVLISSVESGTAAEAAGLQRGDVIQEVNREPIKTVEDYSKASAKVKKDEPVVLLLSRQGNTLFVAVNPK